MLTGCIKQKETYDFEIEGNPSTGFEWTCEEPSGIVEINYTTKATTNEPVTGAPVIYQYKLTGLKEGESTIKCIYKRSWEDDIMKTKEYHVTVDSNLKVKVSEK